MRKQNLLLMGNSGRVCLGEGLVKRSRGRLLDSDYGYSRQAVRDFGYFTVLVRFQDDRPMPFAVTTVCFNSNECLDAVTGDYRRPSHK